MCFIARKGVFILGHKMMFLVKCKISLNNYDTDLAMFS